MRLILALLVLALMASSAAAQTKLSPTSAPAFVSVPPVEDRNLYYAFFNYHQQLINQLQAAVSASPASAAQLNQQMAALLNVNVSELGIVISNTQNVTKAYGEAFSF